MSWQKSMPFSKCSNLEAKNFVLFKLCHQRDKRWNCNLHQTKFRKQAFQMFFFASENQYSSKIQTENKTHQDKNLKITSSIQVMQNLFSFQTPFKF